MKISNNKERKPTTSKEREPRTSTGSTIDIHQSNDDNNSIHIHLHSLSFLTQEGTRSLFKTKLQTNKWAVCQCSAPLHFAALPTLLTCSFSDDNIPLPLSTEAAGAPTHMSCPCSLYLIFSDEPPKGSLKLFLKSSWKPSLFLLRITPC